MKRLLHAGVAWLLIAGVAMGERIPLDEKRKAFVLSAERSYELTVSEAISSASLDEPSLAELVIRGNSLDIQPVVPGSTLLFVTLASGRNQVYRVEISPKPREIKPPTDQLQRSSADSLYNWSFILTPSFQGIDLIKPVPSQTLFLGFTPVFDGHLLTTLYARKEGARQGLDRATVEYSRSRYTLIAGDAYLALLQYPQFVPTASVFRGGVLGWRFWTGEVRLLLGRRIGRFDAGYFDPSSDWLGAAVADFQPTRLLRTKLFAGGYRDKGGPSRFYYGGSLLAGLPSETFFRAEWLGDPQRVYGNLRAGYRYTATPVVDWIQNPPTTDVRATAKDIGNRDPRTEADRATERAAQFGSPPVVDTGSVARPESAGEIVRQKMSGSAEQHLKAPLEISGGVGLEVVPARLRLPTYEVGELSTRAAQVELNYTASGHRFGNRLVVGYQDNQTEQLGPRRLAGNGLYALNSVNFLIQQGDKDKPSQVVNVAYGYDYFRSLLSTVTEVGRHQVSASFYEAYANQAANQLQLLVVDAGTKGVAEHNFDYRLSGSIQRPWGNDSTLTLDATYAYGRSFLSPSLSVRDQLALTLSGNHRPGGKFRIDAGLGISAVMPHAGPSSAIHFLLAGVRWVPSLSQSLDVRWSSVWQSISPSTGPQRFQNFFSINYTLSFGSSVPGGFLGLRSDDRTIRGIVFFDKNFNGTRDAGEPAFSGARIRLDGTRLAITDSSGRFKFEEVPAGKHQVGIEAEQLQKTYDFSTTGEYTLEWGYGVVERFPELVFGLGKAARIHALVFDDIDGDGTRSPEEPGVHGIGGRILAAGATKPLLTWLSGTEGDIRIPALPAGKYRLVLDTEELPQGYQYEWDEKEIDIPERGQLVVTIPLKSLRSIEVALEPSARFPRASLVNRAVAAQCGERRLSARTGTDGTFFLRNIPPGECRFRIDLPGSAALQFTEIFSNAPENRVVRKPAP